MKTKLNINFSNRHERDALYARMERLAGVHTVTISENRRLRSLPQLRLYWVYVHAFMIHLARQGDAKSEAYLHHLLGLKFFPETIFDPGTHAVIGVQPRSLSTMGDVDTADMNAILANVHRYLVEEFGIEMLPTHEEFCREDQYG